MELDKAITTRRSIRKYSDRKPNWRDIIECIDAARYAPSAGNQFPMKFILVDNKKIIQKLADASQQSFVGTVDYIVAVCTDPKRIKNCYEKRADRFCRQGAGAAIQNFLLKIQEKGLATCWVGWYNDNLVKKALKLPAGCDVEAIFPIGYESEAKGFKTSKREKIELDRITRFNDYQNKKMKPPRKLEV